ncbi:MAG: BON domain-containing protein [Candidatus Omnitrophica bacterium]|nr:BON domain-containing protein [Candidatus Omnitrophota bacterium]
MEKYLKVLAAIGLVVSLSGITARAAETDDRIVSSAKESYVFKTYLKGDDIKTESKDGIVTLSGTVSEESHKALAKETVANLPGVKSVDDKLTIEGERPAEASDGWIGTQVKWSLIYNRNVSGLATQVLVKDGVVTLRGEAENQAQKDLAGEYARDVKNVKDVKNEMTIAKVPSEPKKKTIGEKIDDASVTAQVKMAFLMRHSTSAFKTGVSTNNGVVTLTGNVASEAGKSLSGKVAGDVNGVTSVVNNMIVVEPAPKK